MLRPSIRKLTMSYILYVVIIQNVLNFLRQQIVFCLAIVILSKAPDKRVNALFKHIKAVNICLFALFKHLNTSVQRINTPFRR